MTTTEQRMTLTEFLALPEEEPALEFEDGMVTQKVSPKGRHSALQLGTARTIDDEIRPRRLGMAFSASRPGRSSRDMRQRRCL